MTRISKSSHRKCSIIKLLFEISQNSHEHACVGVFATLLKNRLQHEFWGIFKNIFFNRTPPDDCFFFFFFSIWVFFHEHSRFTGQQGKGDGIYLTPLYHFHPLHRHLDISRAITAESSPLHIAGSRTRTGNLWFPSASR